MSEKNGMSILLAFVAGAAVGAAIGYYLNSDKKEEVFNDLKESASKLKNDIEENLNKAREMVDSFTKSATEPTVKNMD